MTKNIKIAVLLSLSLFATSCEKTDTGERTETKSDSVSIEDAKQNKETPKEAINTSESTTPPKIEKKHDDLAQFMAGFDPKEGSTYAQLTNEQGWKNFKAYADNTWAKINGKLETISTWRAEELKKANSAGGTVFYPFSGADFMHVNMFFPEADKYIMIGLEPIGSIPEPNEIKNLNGYFNAIRKTLYAIMELSFFRTKAMANDFTGRVQVKLDGTLPVLLFFLGRTNHEIKYIERVAIGPNGKLMTEGYKGDKNTIYGNKIYFVNKDNPDIPKTLYYFQANVSDIKYTSRSQYSSEGLDKRKDLFGYLSNIQMNTTYLKSASYLMHRETFSKVRRIITDNTKYLLQDDSGIPVKYFDESKWQRSFYGSYYAPIPLFRKRLQRNLRAIYAQKQNIKPLPFGIGYKYQKGTSNLMISEKK